MTANQRFSVTDDRYVIDRLTSKVGKAYCNEGDPENDTHLRQRMLWERLSELTLRLIVNTAPREISFDEKICQPFCAEAHSICMVLYSVIKASHLNTLEVGLSLQHKFDGQLRRNKVGMLGYTSLSLFMDDVECLLRDLYGESDNQAIALVRDAVFSIVDELTKYVRNDLWQEHCNAQHIHHVFRSGPVSGSQFCDMNRAVRDLTQRARDVRANPTAFSKYTVSAPQCPSSH